MSPPFTTISSKSVQYGIRPYLSLASMSHEVVKYLTSRLADGGQGMVSLLFNWGNIQGDVNEGCVLPFVHHAIVLVDINGLT